MQHALDIETPQTIAVLLLTKIGDAVLTTPLFNGLKELYPDADITVITAEPTLPILHGHPSVDQVISVPYGFRQIPALLNVFRKHRYDLYIDPKDHRSTTSQVLARLVRARTIIADTSNIRRGRGYPLPPADAPEHYVDRSLAPLKLLAPRKHFSRRPTMSVPERTRRAVERWLPEEGVPLITVNISSGSESRSWTTEKWRLLMPHLPTDRQVRLLSAPSDRRIAADLAAPYGHITSAETGTVMEGAALLERSELIITPDTSIVHIASALNLPTVALFNDAEWNLRTFGPLSDRIRLVKSPPNSPVSEITVEAVVDAFTAMLNRAS